MQRRRAVSRKQNRRVHALITLIFCIAVFILVCAGCFLLVKTDGTITNKPNQSQGDSSSTAPDGADSTTDGGDSQQEQPTTFAVLFYEITHGAKNDKTMPGYMLENGVELADWLTITADGHRLHLAIDDYLGMIQGQRPDCRAYTAMGKKDEPGHFALAHVVAWGEPDEHHAQLMQLYTLHTGRTPTTLPSTATPCRDSGGNMAGWYDRNERSNE